MIINEDYDKVNDRFYITISSSSAKLTSIIEITHPDYKVDFRVTNSFDTLLGFEKKLITAGYNESTKIVNIMPVNSILVNLDRIMGSYENGFQSPVIYSFFPKVSPGEKIIEKPNPKLIFHPVSRTDISRMRVWLTDQDMGPIDLREEALTVRIYIREVQDTFYNDFMKFWNNIKNYFV